MNIAVIGLRGIPDVQGGIEKHCEKLYPCIVENNGGVTVIGRKGYIQSHPYGYAGTKVVPLWSPRSKNLETIVHTVLCCFWLMRNLSRFHIVHVHAIGPSLFTPLLRLLGFKVIVTNHGPDYNRKKWGTIAKCLLKISESIGSRTAHRIIAVSRQIQYNIKRNYKVDAIFIPNGFTTSEMIPAGDTLQRFFLKAKKYVLYVGRLVPEKGVHDLVKAFSHLRTDWKLVIVGAADHPGHYCRSLIFEASKSENIVMTNFQKGKALAELYSNAGLFVLPSYHEGQSIAALEAMSYNLPILLSDIPANREVASVEETYPVGDVNALEAKLDQFIKNPDGYFNSRLYAIRRSQLHTEYNWKQIAHFTAYVYASLISGKHIICKRLIHLIDN